MSVKEHHQYTGYYFIYLYPGCEYKKKVVWWCWQPLMYYKLVWIHLLVCLPTLTISQSMWHISHFLLTDTVFKFDLYFKCWQFWNHSFYLKSYVERWKIFYQFIDFLNINQLYILPVFMLTTYVLRSNVAI